MKAKNQNAFKIYFFLLMAVFGCLGPIVRAIGFPSAVTACLRAWISGLALVLYFLLTRRKVTKEDLKTVFLPMLFSGILIAGDWIGLFEAYNYTTIATATVCYYMSPVLVLLFSPILLKEKFTLRHGICALISFVGMVLVSGFSANGLPAAGELRGVIFALIGAISYAGIILINKKYKKGDALLRTTIQLSVAAILTTPYILLTENVSALAFSGKTILLLLLLGIGLTALTYIAYFYLIVHIPARSVAIFSYADPVVAVFVSVFFLAEPITVPGIIGSVLIIGAAIVSEFL